MVVKKFEIVHRKRRLSINLQRIGFMRAWLKKNLQNKKKNKLLLENFFEETEISLRSWNSWKSGGNLS